MNSQGFEKVAQNTDIIIYIYKLLKLEDQLRFAQVNNGLKAIFQNHIWRENYSTLTVHICGEDFIVTGERNNNRLHLSSKKFQEFLRIYADQVKVLTELHGTVIDITEFRNLTELSYKYMTISRNHLNLVAKIQPDLQSLEFYCCTDENRQYLEIGKNLDIKALLEMKKLKNLRIENDRFSFFCQATYSMLFSVELCSVGKKKERPVDVIEYHDLRTLLTALPLENLALTAEIIPSKSDLGNVPNSTTLHLKELNVNTTFEPKLWSRSLFPRKPKNFSIYMSNFENLTTLSIKPRDKITQKRLQILADACKNLEILNFRFPTFEKIDKFSTPPKLKELSLHEYDGLTRANFAQLLTEMKIRKLTCTANVNREMFTAFEDISISPLIEALHVDFVATSKIKSAYVDNVNLKELTWYGADTELKSENPHLETCVNLEYLNVLSNCLPLGGLQQLKSLQKLNIQQSMTHLSWRDIIALVKHPSLKEMSIEPHRDSVDLSRANDVPVTGFATNLKFLQISKDVFEMALDFWLDLINQNTDIKLTIVRFYANYDREFLHKLINHPQFPNHRTIDVCCYNLSCCELKRNFEETTKKLLHVSSTFGCCTETCRIVLYRN